MNRSIIFSLLIGAILCVACDPVETREDIGSPITAEQLDVTATALVVDGKNSNKVILENHSPVLSNWDYGIGTSTRAYEEVLLALTGDNKITFKGLNPDGSIITKELTVKVDVLSFAVPAQWQILCGSGEKTWTWSEADKVYGNGSYMGDLAPSWWAMPASEVDGQAAGEGKGASMVFSIAGATLTKIKADGSETKGTFSFDMTKTIDKWSIGQFTTKGVTVLAGHIINDNTDCYNYEILTIDDKNLVLAAPRAGVNSAGGEATFWVFKAK